jgi:hypothetical protein
MQDYGLGLALFDYIPVLFSALGLSLLAGLNARALPGSRPALWAGVALVTAGGLSKASWKLTWVLSQVDIALLSHLLFILMAPGMVLLAFHTAAASRSWRGVPARGNPVLASFVVILPALAAATWLSISQPEGKAWFFALLATASLANISMSGILIRLSWGLQQRSTALIFLFSILAILALSGLSRISEGSAPLQWLAECLNFLAHGSFALAVWRLRKVIPLTGLRVSSNN